MTPPPLPGVYRPPPPDPASLPPPPPLDWDPLPAPAPGTETVGPPEPLLVPAPETETEIEALPAPITASFLSQPDPEPFVLATPWVEIWRDGAEQPELPVQTEKGSERILIASGNPVLIRLLFDPSLTGTPLAVKPTEGVTLQPQVEALNIGAGGECVFLVGLEEQTQAEIFFYSQGVTTELRFQSAPAGLELNP
jgi:hypothetical protein